LLPEPRCLYVAVAVPARFALLEPHAMQHAVAQKPVCREAGFRIGAVAHIDAAGFGRQRALHGKIERLDLFRDGRKIAVKPPRGRLAGIFAPAVLKRLRHGRASEFARPSLERSSTRWNPRALWPSLSHERSDCPTGMIG